jgi:hypothetical protein
MGFTTKGSVPGETRARLFRVGCLTGGEELLKAICLETDLFSRVSISAFIIFLLKIPRDFVSAHAYVGKSKENASRQFVRPNPSHLRFDFPAGFRDGLKRMLQVGARSIKGPNAYQ